MITVLIISDVTLFGEGLYRVLTVDGRLRVLALARTGSKALALTTEHKPQAILLDMSMPSALNLVYDLHSLETTARIVALGLSGEESDVVACAEAGISGYLCREGSLQELIDTVRGAVRGELRCSRRVAAALLRRVTSLAHAHQSAKTAPLTPREREIARLLDRGLTNKEISRNLDIGVGTVKNHVHNILEKLDASTRGEAAAIARELHLIQRPEGWSMLQQS